MRSYFVLRLFPTSYQFLGPYSEDQLCTEMKLGRISLSDLAYSPQDPGKWRRLIKFDRLLDYQPEVPENNELIKFEDEAEIRMKQFNPPPRKKKDPTLQTKKAAPAAKVKPDPLPVPEPIITLNVPTGSKEKIWYLQSQGTEFGPFSFNEFGKIFNSGKLSGKIYAWKEGLVNWMEVQSLEQVITDLPSAERSKSLVIERGFNKRAHIRSHLIATVTVTVGEIAHTGLCLDISQGGLQVGKWGAKLALDSVHTIVITPLGLTGIGPITVEAMVSWIDEKADHTGFRFKTFKKVADEKLLNKYLTTSQKSYR